MIKKLALVAALIALASPSLADSGIRRTPCGYQQITTVSASVGLTIPTTCGGAVTLARFTPEAQAVRYRDDGVAPTAAIGMPVAVGVVIDYEGSLSAIRFIEQTSGAKLNIVFYR